MIDRHQIEALKDVRLRAFQFLEEQSRIFPEAFPRHVLARGFDFEGARVPLVSPQGIFKPAILQDVPLTFTTVPIVEGMPPPYHDELGDDGTVRYRKQRVGGEGCTPERPAFFIGVLHIGRHT